VWALMRVCGIRVLAGIAVVIVNVIRGIPIIVQLFYIYFVLPDFGITLSALEAAIIGLGIAYSAYQSENFRAGIEAVDRGQIEAAHSIGMGWTLTMRRVVLPQAIRTMLPPYGNIMIMMLKDSSHRRKAASSTGLHKAMRIFPLRLMRDSRDGVIHVNSITVLFFPYGVVGLLRVARSGKNLGLGLIYGRPTHEFPV
jgi:His/Glu/Gln/Arg/opine family amino acid ABC transporter permease subunit